jgi:hypothetical protein
MYILIDLDFDLFFSKELTDTMVSQYRDGLLNIFDINDRESPKELTGDDPKDPTSWTALEAWSEEWNED